MSHHINPLFLEGYHDLVESMGGSPQQLLSKARVNYLLNEEAKQFIPYENFVALLELSAQELDRPDFALRLSERQGLQILGSLSVLVRNMDTVVDAFKAISRYIHLQTPAVKLDITTSKSGRCIRIKVLMTDSRTLKSAQFLEYIVGNGQKITHFLAGASYPADEIFFPHPPQSRKKHYQEFFACPVRFDQEECAVDLSINLADKKIQNADYQTAQLAEQHFQNVRLEVVIERQVIHVINDLLPSGHCSINSVAQCLKVHPRTLQRRLAKRNMVFEDLLDEERKFLAKRYLKDSTMPLVRVAGLLGYADQSAFHKAFKRWFKTTPNYYRGS